jgi:hypothetical protein
MVTRVSRGLSLLCLIVGGSTFVGEPATAAAAIRDPASIVDWVHARTPAVWTSAIGEVAWHVGDLQREGAAMEADCSGGVNDGPLVGFSDGVYTQGTTTYWRQAYAHEYGHVVLCNLIAADPKAFDAWMWVAGELRGAPNHVEMFAQCWARLVTGTAPRGYDFRCTDKRAWEATLWVAAVGPVTPPAPAPAPAAAPVPVQPVYERASSAPAPTPVLNL